MQQHRRTFPHLTEMPARSDPIDPKPPLRARRSTSGRPTQDASEVAELIERGLALHRAGRLDDARALYEKVLALAPDQADALHLSGVIDSQSGNPRLAVERIGRAILIKPGVAVYHTNLGNALLALGEAEAAIARYAQAVAMDPDQTDAHANAGRALLDLDRPAEALVSLDAAIAQRPLHAETLNRRANALQKLGRIEESVDSYEAALRADPEHSQTRINLGRALTRLGRHPEAEAAYRAALTRQPNSARVHLKLADTLKAQGRNDEAIACYDRALACPDAAEPSRRTDAAAWNNRGNALRNLGRTDEAIDSFGKAIDVFPEHVEAWFNLANAMKALNRHHDAIACYDRVLQLRPDHALSANNRGVVLGALGRLGESVASLDLAIALDPDNPEPAWNKGIALLLSGDFAQGWRLYEKRWTNDNTGMKLRDPGRPLWLGEQPIAGKTVLLHAEQGLGDTLQFCRFAREVAARGARVVLEVQAPLKPLMQNLEGVSSLHVRGEALPEFDLHCPLLSLPLALGLRPEELPGRQAYLRAPEDRRAHWHAHLGPARAPRIGLVWSGNPKHGNDHNRSIPLAQLLAALPEGPEYFSLQRECRVTDRASLVTRASVRHFGEALTDFGDTAALCEAMDLVITVDTAVAHLSAALGRPTWILLPFVPDWRWQTGREDSPWYPSARLLRQPRIDGWDDALVKMRAALDDWLASEGIASGQPQDALAWTEQGHALRAKGRLAESIRSYDQGLALQAEQPTAWLGKALALVDLAELAPALECFERARTLAPNDPQAPFLQASVLHRLGQLDAALAALDRTIALQPGHVRAWDRRGLVLEALGRVDEAVESHTQALRIDPGDARAARNKGMALLLRGELEEGFRLYERRWDVEPMASAMPAFQQPRWTGETEIAGRTLLLHSEQGLGDTLQFCRYVRLAQARGARVLLEAPDALRPLMSGLEGVQALVRRGDVLPAFDLHAPLMSLPFAFRTELATIPSATPYLLADSGHTAAWRTRLASAGRPVIGLAWSGNPKHAKDAQRSIALETLLPHLPEGARYVALQPDARPHDMECARRSGRVDLLEERPGDFADTAALCCAVDLIVSVDTSIAHLAGALARPTWLLLPFAPDWRWMLNREDTPWYPQTRLYRQTLRGDWEPILHRLSHDLQRWCETWKAPG